jgi:hypothetical protein
MKVKVKNQDQVVQLKMIVLLVHKKEKLKNKISSSHGIKCFCCMFYRLFFLFCFTHFVIKFQLTNWSKFIAVVERHDNDDLTILNNEYDNFLISMLLLSHQIQDNTLFVFYYELMPLTTSHQVLDKEKYPIRCINNIHLEDFL